MTSRAYGARSPRSHDVILIVTSFATELATCTSMYSLTFRVRVTAPRSMDEMERRTQQARRFYRRRGESSPACVVCVWGMRAACGGRLAYYRWALPRISIVLP